MGGQSTALILGALLLSVGAQLQAADAQPAPGAIPLDEIDVVGERAGPRLWKVSKDGHVLWVLGTLTHIPRKMTWRSAEVETALASSQELIDGRVDISADIGPISAIKLYLQYRHTEKVPDHTTLQSWLPAPLYARFERVKSNFDNGDRGIEELRPGAAALRLYDKAVDAAGLTERDTVEQEVERLAKKLHVPVRRPHIDLEVSDVSVTLKEVKDLPPTLEVDCLDATLRRIQDDLQNMQQRAVAWSVGDVDRLRALPFPDQREVCINAISNSARVKQKLEQVQRMVNEQVDSALARNQVTFAMVGIYQLLDPHGPLQKFREEGYTIEGP
jgi:uncharacterized protein YbaP (TraB family)